MISIRIDLCFKLASTFVLNTIAMNSKPMRSIKTILAVSAFILFWLFNVVFILPPKYVRNKAPKIAWTYDQFFGQKWNFFTQPSTYNNRLFFVLKDTSTGAVTDSIDVLRLLWNDKISHIPFNTKYDVLDHVSLHQIMSLRENIVFRQKLAKQLHLDSTKAPFLAFTSSYIQSDSSNNNSLHNLEAIGKLVIEKNLHQIKTNTQYKMLLFTDYTKEFGKEKQQRYCVLEFESTYKFFK